MRTGYRRATIVLAVAAFMVVSSALVAGVVGAPAVGSSAAPTAGATSTPAPVSAPAVSSAASTAPTKTFGIDAGRAATVAADEASYLASGGNPNLFLPPNLHQAADPTAAGPVTPLYSGAPAPMGIAYYGLNDTNGTIGTTTVDTTSLQATFSTQDPLGVQTEEFDFGTQTAYGAQLNAVLTNVTLFGQNSFPANPNAPTGCTVGSSNAPNCPNEFWLQNVINYNPATHSLSFENNIWNFSNPTAAWTSGTNALEGFSTPRGGFYAVNGPSITISYPFTLALYLNTTTGPCHLDTTPGTGVPSCGTISQTAPVNEVFFNYTVLNSLGQRVCPTSPGTGKVCGEYDDVFFNSVSPSVNPGGVPIHGPNGRIGSAAIEANGTVYDPVGLTNDFEMDWGIGTSSGATTVTAYANAEVGINYCPAANEMTSGQCTAYAATPAAYDFGGETGETSSGSVGYWAPQGVSGPGPTLLTGAGTPVAHLVTGASILGGLWNATGAPYPAGGGAYALNYGHISPANAWVGVARGAGVTNQSQFQVAPTFGWFSGWSGSGGSPTPTTLGRNLWLSPGLYTVEVLLGGYDPILQTVNLTASSQEPTITLTRDASTGVYTPLWAFSAGDLANISTNAGSFGLGSVGNQYRIESGAPTVGAPYGVSGSLSWLFSDLNDYLFTVWIGEYINSTTVYAQSNPAPSFLIDYPSWQLPSLNLFDVPYSDQFQLYFYHVQNFTLAGTSGIYAWANSEATTLYSVVCNTCQNDLFAANTFSVSDRGLEFINGGTSVVNGAALTNTRNVVWGNTFTPAPQPSYVGLTAPSTGLVVSESYDRIWNNAFYTNGTASAAASDQDFWNVTCQAGYAPLSSPTYPGPTTCQSASFVTSYLGFSLSGSILGTTYQGGNFWFNYGNAANPYANIPYAARSTSITSSAGIAATANPFRGDYAPLIAYSVYDPTFYATGLPSSTGTTSFEVRVVNATGYGWLNETQTTTLLAVCGGTPCVVFYLPSGTYTYTGFSGLTGASQSAANPATGSFTISGAPIGTVTTFAFSAGHTVTFTESGLTSGTHWSIAIPGQLTVASSTTTIAFNLPNGGYTYQIAIVPGFTTTQSGSFTVSGAALGIPVTFTVTTYAVAFDESGLPASETWAVTLNGVPMSTTTDGGTDSVTFAVANGTWAYSIQDVSGWHQSSLPYSGTVTVNGAPVTENAVFTQVTYAVSFSESGLPAGQTWSVTFNAVPMSTITDGATDTLSFAAEPNGTYAYSVQDVSGWHQSTIAYSGVESVSGGALAVSVVFAQVTYGVSFSESGLPAGQTWMVTFNGGPMSTLTDGGTDALDFGAVANGTFSYAIADVSGWHQDSVAYSGTVTVAGGVASVAVVFTQVTYSVEFDESGLPGGQTWAVSVNGTPMSTTTDGGTDALVFSGLPNGTYAYAIQDVSGWHQSTIAYAGTVTVNGAAVTESVVFAPVLYSVTFTAIHLPNGTAWSITMNSETLSSTGATIVFEEPNGTYGFTVGLVPGYRTSESGSVIVAGSDVSLTRTFSQVKYTVTFKETGLPAGTNWSVTVGATSMSATVSEIHFTLPNGTYAFTVGSVPGYTSASGGSFTVAGTTVTITEAFSVAKYAVTFQETGLPAHTSWSVTVGATTMTATTPKIVFHLANGSYSYAIATVPNYSATQSGSFAVSGAPVTVVTHFTLVKYVVTFTESGLPHHTSWQVTVGSTTKSTTGTSITFQLANGTYAYTVLAPGSGYSATNASVTVNGGPASVSVGFTVGGPMATGAAAARTERAVPA